jgi:molecular chaperone DnaK (HSP70)
MAARYLVGIDLGTTNTACAYVDTKAGRAIRVFPVPQLVAPGKVDARETLPSCCYLAGAHDLPPGSFDLPWASGRTECVGVLAREQGARVPGRLVASAKSWLCHGGVDRTAPILPWGGTEDVPKLSPVDASARTLGHLRDAWDARFSEPLAEQDVVLTVPASFDEVARELTLAAAGAAGLPHVVLLEEPLAAFYAWLVGHERDWKKRIVATPLVLVVDVGGGTTDFSLVAGRGSRGELGLERVAVGEHLLLGGDNMDIALARAAESRLASGAPLDAMRFHLLVAQCRSAKEAMLSDPTLAEVRVTVPGRGTGVVAGTLATSVARRELETIVLDGFFPEVATDARPARTGGGLREWGLPFAADAAITRHLAEFLARQRSAAGEAERPLVRPDAILFNGGALEPESVRERIAAIVGGWHDASGAWRPAVLEADSLQLAVARGAAYYALARRGQGVRIGSGAARTYYLGLQDERLLCVVPRGLDEGESVDLSACALELVTNRPVAFPLFTATDRTGEQAGDVVEAAPGALAALPPLRTVVRFGKKLEERALPVHLEVRLSEVGTLELWLKSRSTEHRWRLELRLRDTVAGEEAPSESAAIVVDPARVADAERLLGAAFGAGDDPVSLVRRLETALEAGRDAWPLAVIRTLWDVVWTLENARARSPEHEARWLNLAGFLLRPGFGDPGDEIRIDKLWRVLGADVKHPRAVQCRAELWNLWKRVAGGLNARQQQHLLELVRPALTGRGKARGPRPGPQELREMWQAIGGCERLAATVRAELARVLAQAIAKGRATDQEAWALARLAARAPIAGPANCVVPPRTASEIVEQLLGVAWARPDATAFALAQVARRTGDRERDLDPALRERVAERLEREPDGARLAHVVRDVVALEEREEARLLDESLPAGLRLRS